MRERTRLSAEPNFKSVDLERLYQANVGRRYYTASFDLMPDDDPCKKSLLDYVGQMHLPAKDGHPKRSLLLHGSHGTGKTAAAVLTLVNAMARGPILAYFEQAANIDHYAINRDVRDEQGQPIWRLLVRDAEFLVIDDLGMERATDWNARWIELVLTERYNWLLPTIITTNAKLEDLYERCPRLKQLGADEYQVIEFTGSTWRG